jgi:tetratricopeptide (TPR) repeat protein
MGLMKFFSRDWEHYLKKGNDALADGRAAEARDAFTIALEKLPAVRNEARDGIEAKVREASNALALLNIREAEACAAAGNIEKAAEHAEFAATLAEDVAIRQMAEKIAIMPVPSDNASSLNVNITKCAGSCCETGKPAPDAASPGTGHEELDPEILINALPGDLPRRYRDLGEKFAEGFLVSRAGNAGRALQVFEDLLGEGENDILLYELALLYHQGGRTPEAERLLKKGLEFSTGNPLIHLALVDLFIEQRRLPEARELLVEMIRQDVMAEHAGLVLGDLLAALGDLPAALDVLAPLLQTTARRDAAQKIVPILMHLERGDEAKQVAKQYLKGCC